MDRIKITFSGILYFLLSGLSISTSVYALASTVQIVQLVQSPNNTRNEIVFSIEPEFRPAQLIVLLDNHDVSALVLRQDDGFHFTPAHALDIGAHKLLVLFTTQDGFNIKKQLLFSIDTQTAYQMKTVLDGSVSVRALLDDSENTSNKDYEVDAWLDVSTAWRNSDWRSNFDSELWYSDLATDLAPFTKDTVQVINFNLTTEHKSEEHLFVAQAGDIEINHSLFTARFLNRRGARADFGTDDWRLGAFSANSKPTIGLFANDDIGEDSNNNLSGLTSSWQLGKNTLLSAIYMSGSEGSNTSAQDLGVFTNSNTEVEGSVYGLLLSTELIKDSLSLEAEINTASFDADINDNQDEKSDEAMAIRLNGYGRWYNYRAKVEQLGGDYAVIANPFINNDRRTIRLNGDLFKKEHNVSLSLTQHQNNIDNDSTRAVIDNEGLMVDYSYRKGRDLSLGINISNTDLVSSKEPTAADKLEQHTVATNLRMSYLVKNWLMQISAGLSKLDDSLDSSNDNSVTTLSFSPAFQGQQISFYPNISKTKAEFENTSTESDTMSLNFRGVALQEKLVYELSAISNQLIDAGNKTDSSSAEFAIDYHLDRGGQNKPVITLGLLMQYYTNLAQVNSADLTDRRLWLNFTISLPSRY